MKFSFFRKQPDLPIREDAAEVRMSWLRKKPVTLGEQLCFFVTYAPGGAVPAHSLSHARAWFNQGYSVTLIIVVDRLEDYATSADTDFAARLCVRLNAGYDFGAWGAAITQTPDLKNASILAIANDSVFGPSTRFPRMLKRAAESNRDIVALTESLEIKRHLQSYIMFFRQSALTNRTFQNFWRTVKVGDRRFVIDNYELNFLSQMTKAGLKATTLFTMKAGKSNPTLKYWRELLEQGFPFVKVQLLRENPEHANLEGWEEYLLSEGFDVKGIRHHLDRNV